MPANGISLDRRLQEQNNQHTLWLDCERRGLKHQLGPREVSGQYSTVRRCRRCPVDILTMHPAPR